jgi:hypothetical protein
MHVVYNQLPGYTIPAYTILPLIKWEPEGWILLPAKSLALQIFTILIIFFRLSSW